MRTWTDREVSILLENYNKVSNSVLISMIPEKSKQGIYKKAYKLGLRKDKNIEFINRSEARRRENASKAELNTQQRDIGRSSCLSI